MIYRQPKKRGNLMTGEELKQQIALYESADHTVHLDVKVDEDTVGLTDSNWHCCLAAISKQSASISAMH